MRKTEMNAGSEVRVRVAQIEDAQKLLEIYGYYVKNTAITYEYDVPGLKEFEHRIERTLESYPYLVAEADGDIIGYAYAGPYHHRAAYHWIAEMTVYLDHSVRGSGVGQRLYRLLEQILTTQGVVKVIALITAPPTEEERRSYNSMHFHEKMGYHLIGRIENSGYKFNRWFDTVLMDKRLGVPTETMQHIKSFDDVRAEFGL